MIKLQDRKTAKKVISFILVLALVGTGVLGSMASISIQPSEDKSKAAVNYLVDNFDFMKENRLQRMGDLVSLVGKEETSEDYYKLAATQIASEKYTDALASIDQCIAMYGDKKDGRYLDLIMKKGCLYIMTGDYKNALKYIDEALRIDPNWADAHLIKAQIFAETGNQPQLIASLESYMKLRPNDTEIRKLLAQAKFTSADYGNAITEYEKILEKKPDPQISYLYGLTAIQLGKYAEAEENLTKAIGKDDTYDGIYYYRGVCRMSNNNYEGAVSDFTKSIEKASMTQASYYTRGVCSLMLEKYDYDAVKKDLQTASQGTDKEVAAQAKDLLQKLKTADEEAIKAAEEAAKHPNASTEEAIYAKP
ncbi:MAG: tetratricopeptide repeat protein [Anaerovorax sp.]